MSKLEELLADYLHLCQDGAEVNEAPRAELVAAVLVERDRLVRACQTAYDGMFGERPRPTMAVVERDLKRALVALPAPAKRKGK